MRRCLCALLLALFAITLVPVMPASHAGGCACPGGSCRCDHSAADVCGTAASSSDCAMDRCDESTAAAPFPSVVMTRVSGVSLPEGTRTERASRPFPVDRSRDIPDPPPRSLAC
ncbi:MAG: hypothetical protein WC538_01005 [Thermoanaerobaculia bacterium]